MGSVTTQQKSQGIRSVTAARQVPRDLCVGVGSQKVVKVKPGEFIRPKQTMTWPYEAKSLHQVACEGTMALVLEPHNLVCPRFCQASELSKVGCPGVRKLGLVDLL